VYTQIFVKYYQIILGGATFIGIDEFIDERGDGEITRLGEGGIMGKGSEGVMIEVTLLGDTLLEEGVRRGGDVACFFVSGSTRRWFK